MTAASRWSTRAMSNSSEPQLNAKTSFRITSHPIYIPTGDHLKGAVYSDREPPRSYHVFERNHRFTTIDGTNYRENEIWREAVDKRTGNKLREELQVQNFSQVKYELNFPTQQCSF